MPKVTVRPVIPPPLPETPLDRDLRRARVIAKLLDAQFQVGKVSFGADAILGLIPGIGDGLSAVIGGYLIYVAHKHKLGKRLVLKMLWNLLLDWLVGLVPVVGDIFDVFLKAHLRNLALLEKAVLHRRQP